MDIIAIHREGGSRGIEGFDFDFAQRLTVDGIGEIGGKFTDIEMLGSGAHFFIRCEGDSQSAVFDFRMFLQMR